MSDDWMALRTRINNIFPNKETFETNRGGKNNKMYASLINRRSAKETKRLAKFQDPGYTVRNCGHSISYGGDDNTPVFLPHEATEIKTALDTLVDGLSDPPIEPASGYASVCEGQYLAVIAPRKRIPHPFFLCDESTGYPSKRLYHATAINAFLVSNGIRTEYWFGRGD
jgi:hypothetical protein